MHPKLIIDLHKLRQNISYLSKKMKEKNLTVGHVTKVYCADPIIVNVFNEFEEIDYFADSRIDNIKQYPETNKEKILVRIPMHSEVSDVVKYADISFNSEISTIRLLNKEAKNLNKKHKIVIMVDLGDLREGYFYENQVMQAVAEIVELDNIELYGIGVNLTCYGAIIPDATTLLRLVDFKYKIESNYNVSISMVSGGNSSSVYLLDEGGLPEGVNNLRVGEAFVRGCETAYGRCYEEMHQDAFILSTELVELKEKPSVPIGNIGVDAFGQKPVFKDKGQMLRGIVAIGRQDTDYEGLIPVDEKIEIVGASSDHLILDFTNCDKQYHIGDSIEFNMTYSALLNGFTSHYVKREYIGMKPE
ncbi:ornithine racemase Orr [Bacillus tuaregi]|uniref:ornithine racemase Orr n=1 Tax=Bacillus tuaregi TaxID=1816695 RepID=UPI0008F8FA5F|nr:ornithine racemase Orr [Bacillus tuaregi]